MYSNTIALPNKLAMVEHISFGRIISKFSKVVFGRAYSVIPTRSVNNSRQIQQRLSTLKTNNASSEVPVSKLSAKQWARMRLPKSLVDRKYFISVLSLSLLLQLKNYFSHRAIILFLLINTSRLFRGGLGKFLTLVYETFALFIFIVTCFFLTNTSYCISYAKGWNTLYISRYKFKEKRTIYTV